MTTPTLDEVKALAMELHRVYQDQARAQSDTRHPDDYDLLPETIKEYHRAFSRWILTRFVRREEADQRTVRINELMKQRDEEQAKNDRLRAELKGQRCDGSGHFSGVTSTNTPDYMPCPGCPACKPTSDLPSDRVPLLVELGDRALRALATLMTDRGGEKLLAELARTEEKKL